MHKKTILILALVLVPVLRASSEAQDQKPFRYTVLSSDSHDLTHFGDEHVLWQSDGKPNKLASPFLDAEKIGFMHFPQGYRSDWHPAPRKQFVMVMQGVMEIEAGDGQRRKFVAGEVLLVTDTQGHGHRTNVLGNQDVIIVWVRVPYVDSTARLAHEAYTTAINSNNLDSLTGMFTEDVVFLAAHAPPIVGKAAVRKWAEDYFQAFTTHWDKTLEEFVVAGGWAFERYSYKSTDTPKAGGAAIQDTGWGLVIYRRGADGKWRVARDAFSTDTPVPTK